jgi:hypothetical protein
MLDMRNRLGLAAGEHIAIKLRPLEQLLGGLADRLQPAQARASAFAISSALMPSCGAVSGSSMRDFR